MKLGFHTITFSPFPTWAPFYSLEETARTIAKYQYEGIELVGVRPHAWPDDWDQEGRKRLKKLFAELKLEFIGVTPVVAPLFNPASTERNERMESLNYLKKCLEFISDMGGGLLAYSAGLKRSDVSYTEAWKLAAESLAILSDYATPLGVKIAFEPIWSSASNIVYRSDLAIKMADEVNRDNIGFLMDTYHVWVERENPYDVIKSYGDRLLHVHFEDYIPTPPTRVIPGEGAMDLRHLLQMLKDSRYKGFLTIELLRESDPVQAADKSKQVMNRLLREVGC